MKKNYVKDGVSPRGSITFKLMLLLAILILPFGQSILTAQTITYSFTTAGATGSVGPNQTQINTAYSASNLSMVICPAGVQSWTVPNSGLYLIDCVGASGGNAPSYNRTGGLGARMQGQFNLIAGQVLQIVVGQVGQNGCGNGGGGGGSYVASSGLPLIVAGGGGGCSSDQNGVNAPTVTAGTQDSPAISNGGTNGGGGSTCNSGSYNGGGGGGFNVGTGGNGQTPSVGGGGGLSFLNGSTGGFGHLNSSVGPAGGFGGGGGGSNCTVGGGGGGGYSGGAGGQHLNQCTTNSRSGGGGGGSFNGGTSQVNTAGFNSGNGRVTITSLCSISLYASTTNSLNPSICAGNSISLMTNAMSNYNWSTGNTTSSVIVVSPTVTTTYSISATSTANCNASAAITVTVSGGLPVLAVTSSTNQLCLGRTLTLTATGALTYTWSGGANNGVGFVPTATAIYTVTGGNGCGISTATTAVTVAPLPVAVVSTPTISCATRAVTLTATSGVNGYTWQPGGQTGGSVIVAPSITTLYSVTASDGTCSGTATLNIPVNPLPTVAIVSTSSVVCQGGVVSMTASGGLSYTWNPGNLTGSVITVNPTGPTLYSVVANNTFNCTDGANQVVLTNPSPTITIAASDNLICNGGTSTLTANGASTYTWLNTNANTNAINVNPTSTTVYSVTGLTTGNNCPSTQTVQVAVFDASVAVSGQTAICSGGTSTLTASGADSYTWDNGAPIPVITVNPLSTTVYTVTALTATGNINCSSTNTIQVTVNPNPTVSVVPTRTFMCAKESNTLTASGASTYSWNTTATTPVIVVTSSVATTINYSVTGTDANGCTNVKLYQLKVNGCTAINENTTNLGLVVYPNPNNGNFSLETDADVELRISNELGQVVKVIQLNAANNHKASVEGLASGIYFVSGNNINTKIVVQQ